MIRRIGGLQGNYRSMYPPAHSDTYVKATTYTSNYYAYFATNPSKSLTGSYYQNSWQSSPASTYNQRFHVDLGAAHVIERIYYENGHNSGASTNLGAKTFTVRGSNNSSAFAELTYSTDTNWTAITASQATLDQHVDADQADPKYITLANSAPYRYYAMKIADNWGNTSAMSIRRIELQVKV